MVTVLDLAVAVLVAVTPLAVTAVFSAEGSVRCAEQVEVPVAEVRQALFVVKLLALALALVGSATPLAVTVASSAEGAVQWAE